MNRLLAISLIGCVLLTACATAPAVPERATDDSMVNFLPYLNQKVAGYLDEHNITTLDMNAYKTAVNEVCSPLPLCGKNADIMFSTYNVQVRSIEGIFSLMLCDNKGVVKKMEDFSCDENKVEIQSFKNDIQMQCSFEVNWKGSVAPYCPELK